MCWRASGKHEAHLQPTRHLMYPGPRPPPQGQGPKENQTAATLYRYFHNPNMYSGDGLDLQRSKICSCVQVVYKDVLRTCKWTHQGPKCARWVRGRTHLCPKCVPLVRLVPRRSKMHSVGDTGPVGCGCDNAKNVFDVSGKCC